MEAFHLKDFKYEILNPHDAEGKLGDFCDGSLYKEHPLFSVDKEAIQIVGYYI